LRHQNAIEEFTFEEPFNDSSIFGKQWCCKWKQAVPLFADVVSQAPGELINRGVK
jgi:hypothetical protein